jgi:hypothetical protein
MALFIIFNGMGESYDFIGNINVHIPVLLCGTLPAVGVHGIGAAVDGGAVGGTCMFILNWFVQHARK